MNSIGGAIQVIEIHQDNINPRPIEGARLAPFPRVALRKHKTLLDDFALTVDAQ